MPAVTCPTCGERGKIPSSLIGARIKCRKCGMSFQVSPPVGKAAVGAGTGVELSSGHAAGGPSAAVEAHGIEVEGLDASAWTVPTDAEATTAAVPAEPEWPTPGGGGGTAAIPFRAPDDASSLPTREYKLLTSRDKFFDGKFDLARMEEALNHFARLGWAARSMATPHVKGYTGVIEEVIVVLLERDRPAS